MLTYNIPKQEDMSKEQAEKLNKFFLEFIDLCNKHRITFIISSIFFLQTNIIDGKLLDVAGFSYNEKEHKSFPVFVDTMSNNDK